MQTLVADVRYAIRTSLKSPGFTAVAVLTIALGIGANAAIFTIVNAMLLEPLPYPGSGRLVMLWQDWTRRGGPADEWASPGNFVDWRAEHRIFAGVAAIGGWRPTLTGEAEPEALPGEQVSHEYFSVLGIPPAVGRDFRAEDDVPNAPRVAIISHELWQRRFGGDPRVIGQSVPLSGDPHTVIGVLPPGVRPIVNPDADIWRPLRIARANPARGAVVLRVVARLADGVEVREAQAAMTALAQRLEQVHPDFNTSTGFVVEPLLERVTGQIRPGLLALSGAVGFVLLIACANLANLLTVRGSARSRELAVRVALGARRGRIVRLLLTESVLLALAGGAAGVLLSVWAVDVLVALAPASAPRLGEVRFDATVVGFTALLIVATGLFVGLLPAIQHARGSVAPALNDAARGTTAAGGRFIRRGLVTAEVALALVLLSGAALLIQTFVNLQQAELGFRTSGVVTGFVAPPPSSDSSAKRIAFFDQLLERVSAIPGVDQAALASVLPLAAGDSDTNFFIEGRPAPQSPADQPVTWYRSVSAGYFDAIGMPLRRGRHFAPREAAPSVIVNDTFVRRYFPAEEPLGRRIRAGGPDAPWFTIVGVVADARGRGAREQTRVETFIPYWQLSEGGLNVVLRGGNPAALAAPLRQAVAAIDRNTPVVGLRTMDDIYRESVGEPRFFATLAGAFALLALVLAAIGIYGVVAFAVSQRTAEIGVRMAVGASLREVFRMIVADGLKLAALGTAIGIAGAVFIARSLESLLYGVAPGNPALLALAAAVLVAIAVLASAIPAWRATRIDPIAALRAD
jgi:predicted permease